MSRPIKRWNTDPNSSPEPTLVYAEKNQVGPDYAYGAEALEAFRKDLGLSAKPPKQNRVPDGVVHAVHRCAPPSTRGLSLGSIWYCDTCGRFAEVYRYRYPARQARPSQLKWKSVGPFKQRKLERKYL